MAALPETQATTLELAHTLGMLRIRDCTAHGRHPEHVRRLCEKGLLEPVGRGCYRPVDADMTEHLPTVLSPQGAADAVKQTQWAAFVRRSGLDSAGASLEEVTELLRLFMAPLVGAADAMPGREWPPGGPWRPVE